MNTGPLVIAHRGASGYLPEHTREAKILAYGQGAHYLEQDIVATRDGQLVVLHDVYLDDVTDVGARYASRRRPDGRHYVIDFDLHELRELSVVERRYPGGSRQLRPERFRDREVQFQIVTLDEEIRLIQELNRTTGRRVGIYPELKEPQWHRQQGVDTAAALLETLAQFGYRNPEDCVFVQCFDAAELRRCREELGTRLQLVQLTDKNEPKRVLPAALDRIAAYADVIAPHYSQLLDSQRGRRLMAGPLAAAARARGLKLHPYTLRRDGPAPFEQLLEFLVMVAGIDGIFCDHPDAAIRTLDRLRRAGSPAEDGEPENLRR